MSAPQGNGRGGRTRIRDDAGALAGGLAATGAVDGDDEAPQAIIDLGTVEEAVMKDLIREYFIMGRHPIGQKRRDEIISWHSRSPGSVFLDVLRRKEALVTDDSDGRHHDREVIPMISGVTYNSFTDGVSWEADTLKGQQPGHDGQLRGLTSSPVVWPARLDDGPWIERPDAGQVVLSPRVQECYTVALAIVTERGWDRPLLSSEITARMQTSSPRSTLANARDKGLFKVIRGKGGKGDPFKYVVILRPHVLGDGTLVVPPQCERWQELLPETMTSSTTPPDSEPELTPAPEPSTAPESMLKSVEDLQDELQLFYDDRQEAVLIARDHLTRDQDAQLVELTVLRESLKEQLAEVVAQITTLTGQRTIVLDNFVPEDVPAVAALDTRIAGHEQLIKLYSLLVK